MSAYYVLSVADEIEKELDQALARSERLRQSILKRAFEAQLVGQGERMRVILFVEKV